MHSKNLYPLSHFPSPTVVFYKRVPAHPASVKCGFYRPIFIAIKLSFPPSVKKDEELERWPSD